eukprot:g5962.t1
MESSFSGVVKLDNISDFITTSQNCIVASNAPQQPKKEVSTEPVKISLQDCLACSGCVTTAETILLENQSTEEFLRKVNDKNTQVAVSISSQSRAALSVEFGLTPINTLKALVHFLRELGVDFVFDHSSANDLTLLAASEEFNQHFHATSNLNPRPILASTCPGWVCYVEKTHGDLLIPYLSKIRSAQAVMGKILKSHFCERVRIDPKQMYHCTIMSCFDKKLEASRHTFLTHDLTPEVDSCLTTTELISIIKSSSKSTLVTPSDKSVMLDNIIGSQEQIRELQGSSGSSGGLLEYIYRRAARSLFQRDIPPGPLPLKALRNQNFQEVCLEDENGEVLLKFAYVYGFRNIQTLVRKIKTGRCDYHYVEVMACPFGCLNGGGQPKPTDLISLKSIHEDIIERDPDQNLLIVDFVDVDLTTTFHKVEKNNLTVIKDW